MNITEGAARRLATTLSLVLAVAFGSASARAETSVVVDVDTGKVLSTKDATARWYPASTTKLMTAYLALKALKSETVTLDSPVVMTRYAAGQAPSKMGFEPGTILRLDMAMRMMLVKSANDVAVAIGQALGGGSIEAFVGMMNAEADRLGMKDTRFINPNGLPGPGQFSSAKDLAILAIRLRRDFPAFSEIFGVEAISTGNTLLRNTNALLGRYEGADGMKTGYICASGFNVVASATRGKRTIVAVVLGAEGTIVRDRMAAELLENGFRTDPAKMGTLVEALPASSGPPADISKEICSPAGQQERAKERQAEAARAEKTSGSPYLHEMKREPATVPVSVGGAAAGDTFVAGITQIPGYGIPLPRWRPDIEQEAPTGGDKAKAIGSPLDPATSSPDQPESEKVGRLSSSIGEDGLRGGMTN
ncbi:D-alanyl-D-alanine carboxypeptidase [Aureimonas sp. SA4125]|uniref:D-alanyl-D-alanine carboxypeptidase family protein n=1 Tax=Aureimonas sp. SA4125 TaxID=2826993 RepID=UPI001CC6D7C0|nr:D-alanyl-D-alanine carboxypeptidase family protein [Aureimonas sp. SA4125]BDA86171.1 D-alanyl-D-alanine carboxypeptidase [Aureimonas sp. SA4125]